MLQTSPTFPQLSAALPDGVTPPESPTAEQTRILLQQTAPDPPQAVQDYLGMLGLLYGVPFENLVADERMLPRESLRFFYLDANWIASLVDGALSAGVHSDRDIRFSRVLGDTVRYVTELAIGEVRPKLRGETAGNTLGGTLVSAFANKTFHIVEGQNDIFSVRVDNGPEVKVQLTAGSRTAAQVADNLNGAPALTGGIRFAEVATASAGGGTLSIAANAPGAALRLGSGTANLELGFTPLRAGFLMRSAVVSGWPGLEVKGYRDTNESDASKIDLLRMDRLAPDVLLVIFESVPGMVVVNEPREALHFGIGSISAALRNPNQLATGGTIKPGLNIPTLDDPTVIDVLTLVGKLPPINAGGVNSADVGVQLVDSAIKILFKPKPEVQ